MYPFKDNLYNILLYLFLKLLLSLFTLTLFLQLTDSHPAGFPKKQLFDLQTV